MEGPKVEECKIPDSVSSLAESLSWKGDKNLSNGIGRLNKLGVYRCFLLSNIVFVAALLQWQPGSKRGGCTILMTGLKTGSVVPVFPLSIASSSFVSLSLCL